MKENNESTVNWKKRTSGMAENTSGCRRHRPDCQHLRHRQHPGALRFHGNHHHGRDRLLGSRLSYRFGSHPERATL